MKKFSKILVLVLSLVIALSAFAIASSANSSPFLVEGLYRETWGDAIANAYIKGDRVVPVELLRDYEVDGESVEITESVVISLNGHTLKSESSEPLFKVSGKDTTLTIIGPGTISVSGALVDVESGAFVFDATQAFNIQSSGTDSVVTVGSEASVSVIGALGFESAGAALFELNDGAEFNIAEGNSVSATCQTPATVILANAGSSVNVKGTLSVVGGSVIKIGEDTTADKRVNVNFDGAIISSEGAVGSVVEAGAGYADVSVKHSNITASGGAFSADDTLASFEGEGADKVYAKPKMNVEFTVSTYSVSEAPNNNASLFYGNITAVVTASDIKISDNSAITMYTRIWDGECGILLKKGVKVFSKKAPESETPAPSLDEDGTMIYFNPSSVTNKNFSLDTIDGEPYKLVKTTSISGNNDLYTYFIVTDKILSFVDGDFSSNFNDPNGNRPYANAITQSYGEITIPTVEEANGSTNGIFMWEYDIKKNDQFKFASGNSYIELDAGGSNGSVRGFDALVNNELITWDFDISTSNGVYSYAGLKMFIREKGASYAYTDNFAYITANTFKVGDVAYKLPTTPYVWTHITLVLDIDSSGAFTAEDGTTICYPNLNKSKIHFYANGVYQSSVSMFNANVATEAGIKKSSEFSLDSIRFGMTGGPSVSKTQSTSLLLDNNILTYYPKGYEGNVPESEKAQFLSKLEEYNDYVLGGGKDKTLSDFVGDVEINLKDVLLDKSLLNINNAYDVAYRNDYYMPGVGIQGDESRQVVAIVDGVKYYNIEDAFGAITSGSVVYLCRDVEGVYNATTNFTVYTKNENGGNYKFDVSSDTYYLSEIRENGNVVGYRTMTANSFITVYWYMEDGVYESRVPLGIVPSFEGELPESYYDKEGRYIELIGFSTNKNATTPEEIVKITKDDLIKGYKIYYPVISASSVPVRFLDANGDPILDGSGKEVVMQIPVGTPESDLKFYFDGSVLPAHSVEGNDWYEQSFSSWSIGAPAVGTDPVNANPVYDGVRIKASAIKTNFSIVRLVDFAPTLYVLKPDSNSLPAAEAAKIAVDGFSLDGKNLLTGMGDWSNQYVYENVKIGDKVYYKFNLSRSKYFGKPGSETLEDFTIFVHYTYDGTKYTEEVKISMNSYLKAVFESATDSKEKSAILEIMRLVKTYLELAEKTDIELYNTCSSYVNDSANAAYLSDYINVMDRVSDEKKAANEAMLNELYQHANPNIRWNFVNNTISFNPIEEKYPRLVNAWTVSKYEEDGIMVKAVTAKTNARMSNGFNKALSTYSFGFSFGSNSNYGTSMITAYDSTVSNTAADMVGFQYCNEYLIDGRKVLFTVYYNLTAHITELEKRVAAGETDAQAELNMAKIILATQMAVGECVVEDSSTPVIPGVVNPPVATLPRED